MRYLQTLGALDWQARPSVLQRRIKEGEPDAAQRGKGERHSSCSAAVVAEEKGIGVNRRMVPKDEVSST